MTRSGRGNEHDPHRRFYSEERLAPGVALQRRLQRDALLRAARGGDLQLFIRPQRGRGTPHSRRAAWIAFLFASTVALNQSWARELRGQVLDAFRVSPAPANSLFIGKSVG